MDGIKEMQTVNQEANRIFIGKDILGGALLKSTYEKLLTSLNVMKTIVRYLLKKTGLGLSDIELEAESWRILIRSSQKHYPAKIRKGLLEKQIYCIRLAKIQHQISANTLKTRSSGIDPS